MPLAYLGSFFVTKKKKFKIMNLKLFSFLFLFAISYSALAQINPYYHENAVFHEEIKSVQLFREGFELSNPDRKSVV